MATKEARKRASRAYNDRMKRTGHVKVAAWVPEEYWDEFLDFAAELRRRREAGSPKARK